MNTESIQVYLKHPFTMVISGPTGSGKTQFVKRLIEKASLISKPKPEKIFYAYGQWQTAFEDMVGVRFLDGISENIMDHFDSLKPSWLIIDDLMTESANSKLISSLFVRGSHHKNVSVILIVQNFFMKGKESRDISLNSQYLVLMKNPRDRTLASRIAMQLFPGSVKQVQNIFNYATKKPYSYLFLDLKPDTDERVRLLSDILGESNYITVYPIV